MKRILLALLFWMGGAGAAQAETHFVRMLNGPFRFDPANLTVNVGDTVIWTNRVTTLHDTVSEGVWASPLFGFRGSFSFTFNVPPKTYNYVCTPHVDAGMIGTITVAGPPNGPPTASISAPANGAVFLTTDTIRVAVDAADDAGVAKVELVVDDAVTQTKGSGPFEFSLTLGVGAHTIRAVATDALGLSGSSGAITVTVRAPNQRPAVSITTPMTGATFTAPASLTIEANATDDVGVDRVEFFVDGVLAGTDRTPGYSLARVFAAGNHQITAVAYDGEGLSAVSAPVAIQVSHPPPSAPVVEIVYPLQGQYLEYATNRLTTLAARAGDADGTVATVEFFEGTNSLGLASHVPADTNILVLNSETAFPANTLDYLLARAMAEGRHTIVARATDNAGNVATSDPVSFTMALRPTLTSAVPQADGAMRLSVFGTSGAPHVFEHSEDGVTWTPFLTNALYRRILFFDDVTAAGRTNRMYRARSP